MKGLMITAGVLAVAVLAGGAWWMAQGPHHAMMAGGAPMATVRIPVLSDPAARGAALFDAHCAACHGANAAGSNAGPPLVHRIYEPSHHGDGAFQRAVAQGVRPHHWGFGPMPPIAGVSPREVSLITAYVRELQRANGIH
jgi:mono/diheme cytochrome c family protein